MSITNRCRGRPPLRGAVFAEFRPHRRVARIGCIGVALTTASLAVVPLVVEKVIDNGILEHSKGWVYACAAVAAVLVVAQVVGSWLEVAFMGRFAEGYQKDLRASMMSHLYGLDLDYFTREPAAASCRVSRATWRTCSSSCRAACRSCCARSCCSCW